MIVAPKLSTVSTSPLMIKFFGLVDSFSSS